MELHYCPLHAHEVVRPKRLPDGALLFVCPLPTGHVEPGPLRWMRDAPPLVPAQAPGAVAPARRPGGSSGLAKELDLAVELPAALAEHRGWWVEYGVLEHTYARRRPDDFARLVEIYGHTAVAARTYPFTASRYLAHRLGDLARLGKVVLRFGPATGRWGYDVDDHVHDRTWTTDRSRAARRWGQLEPDLAAGLGRLLSWTTADRRPASDQVRRVLADDGIVADVVDRFTRLIGLWPDDPHDQ